MNHANHFQQSAKLQLPTRWAISQPRGAMSSPRWLVLQLSDLNVMLYRLIIVELVKMMNGEIIVGGSLVLYLKICKSGPKCPGIYKFLSLVWIFSLDFLPPW